MTLIDTLSIVVLLFVFITYPCFNDFKYVEVNGVSVQTLDLE